jgi:hypothetical protein
MDLLRLLNDGGINGGEKPKNGGVNLEELIFTTIQDTPGINAPAIADTLPEFSGEWEEKKLGDIFH